MRCTTSAGLALAVVVALAGQGAAMRFGPLWLGSSLALRGSALPCNVQFEPGRFSAEAHEIAAPEIPLHAAVARQPERTKAAELTWLEAFARAELLASHQLQR